MEVVTGKRWEDFLRERILLPLGMKTTTFRPSAAQLAGKMEMYDVKGGQKAKHREYADSMQPPYGDDRVFASAGAGLWTCAREQVKFYEMLKNLGVGANGTRILKEETVRKLLAASTRPAGMDGYSLGLKVVGDGWFGHGGAWGTKCMVNPDKRELDFWVVQQRGGSRPWKKAKDKVADAFFSEALDHAAADSYTGRMK